MESFTHQGEIMLRKLCQKNQGIDKNLDFNFPVYITFLREIKPHSQFHHISMVSAFSLSLLLTQNSLITMSWKGNYSSAVFFVCGVDLKTLVQKGGKVFWRLCVQTAKLFSILFCSYYRGTDFPELPVCFLNNGVPLGMYLDFP